MTSASGPLPPMTGGRPCEGPILLSCEGFIMTTRRWAAGAVLAVGLLLGPATARGEDVFRLNLPPSDDAPAMKLGQTDADADTLLTWGRGGFRGGWGGGYRGGWHGGYGGYRGYGYG